ncbi:MAG: TIGR02677 family protein [Clostridia bacterium]
MLITDKMVKQISETKYLTAENSYRYRPIMRYFLEQYEQIEYWLYKEDVFKALKDNTGFLDYTIDECERDLDTLVEWQSLDSMQDTKNPSSLEEIKNKRFRYQLTDYGVAIERLIIELENMQIKTASLEPKMFERIKNIVLGLKNMHNMSESDVNELWQNLNTDFTNLNQNYQDFLKKFNEAKTEELLQSDIFLEFKSEMVRYLKQFIKGYQQNVYFIQEYIQNITLEDTNYLMDILISYQKKVPKLVPNFDFDKLRNNNFGKWQNIRKWFIGNESSDSEGSKLMNATNNIIVKITKYASSLADLHGNMTSRKEEYKHLCRLFDQLSLGDCHKLSALIFGIDEVKHFVGSNNSSTDTIVNAYDTIPLQVPVAIRNRVQKRNTVIVPMVDKSYEKEMILDAYRKQQQENKKLLQNLIVDKKIVLENNVNLTSRERKYILKLLNNKLNGHETEFGLNYKIQKTNKKCYITAEDGDFIMNGVVINFEGDINE